mmetsp:Transcript_28695/g.37619  ORF Transcript_28695/g.37619 Transcript_28695/m.37619 type:complete len:396 (-) Transcript_28695:64-1251(-)
MGLQGKRECRQSPEAKTSTSKKIRKINQRKKTNRNPNSLYIHFSGCSHFRQRIICSTLSGKPVKIRDIRVDDEEQPGLKSFEASFLRLVEKLTNGCQIEINETGTLLSYRPGFIRGGRIEHDCGNERAIGWFLEGILPLAPFSKEPFKLSFTGITNDHVDTSVDVLKNVTLPSLKHFGIEGSMNLQIKKRGAPPEGGGLVEFVCPILRELRPIDLTDAGLIKRIRGVAYSTRVSPQTSNRVVSSGRALLNRLIPDVYIYTDHFSGKDCGKSPGFALSLVAESTTGMMLSAEVAAEQGTLPEDLGSLGSKLLLQEIKIGGCIDRAHQPLFFLLMVLCPEDVSRLRIGNLTPQSIQTLRLLKEFFGVMFKLKPDKEQNAVLVSCLGSGFKNVNRRVT